jgi:hypothetical protein
MSETHLKRLEDEDIPRAMAEAAAAIVEFAAAIEHIEAQRSRALARYTERLALVKARLEGRVSGVN